MRDCGKSRDRKKCAVPEPKIPENKKFDAAPVHTNLQ